MTTLATFNSYVDRILQDDAGKLSSDEIDAFIQNEGTQLYSKHKPYTRKSDISASGSYSYEINSTNFPSWSEGFSYISRILYPADQYQDPRDEEIAFEDWEIYETASSRYLRFTSISPTSGYTIRVLYTTPHSVPGTGAATIYAADEGAFVNLCASLCASAIARGYGQTSNSTIGADAIAYRDKSDIWASRAKDLFNLYVQYMFPDHVQANMALREFDTKYAELGFGRLTHKSWTR